MRQRTHLLIAVCLLTGIFASCGPRQPADLDLTWLGHPIINGDPDTTQEHQAVVYIQIDVGGGYAAACTGTLIAPDVVLTAGHCVCSQNSTTQFSSDRFDIFFGNSVNSMFASRSVSEVLRHPNYDPDWYYGAPSNDIALLRLSSSAPASVSPIPHLPTGLAVTGADEGTNTEYVGFGQTENGGSGTKLYVWNAIDKVCTSLGGCNFGNGGLAAPHTICSDQSPGGPCSGDSGGPAFLDRAGQEYVVGVTSYGDQNCTQYGCSTKVDTFDSWISDFIGGMNGSSCSSAGQCDSGYCVDGVCCNSSCNGACTACDVAGQRGTCVQVSNGTPCPDSDPCNGTETCQSGNCLAGAAPTCDDRNICTVDSCLPGTGCIFNPYADGTNCADNDVCNGVETCRSGLCQSSGWLSCDDHNPCTSEACDSIGGCINAPIGEGTVCDMGMCGAGSCLAGVCTAGDGAVCDDHRPCTEDTCVPEVGCLHDPLPDGFECGECSMCLAGVCSDAPNCGTDDCDCAAASGHGKNAVWVLAMLLLGMRRFRG